MQSLSLHNKQTNEQRRKIKVFKLSILDSRLVGKHAIEPVWIQVQQRDCRRDLRVEADTGEMQRTEHGSICSFRRPDQGL